MNDIVTITQAGMLADVERMRAVSQNLANVSTLGYKRELVVMRPFVDMLDDVSGSGRYAAGATVTPVLSSATDHSAGSLKFTGNPLDLSLEDDVYFVVQGARGEALTRQGNFRLDASGRLVTASGAAVLGAGGEIRLTTPNPNINEDGTVWEGAAQVGQLRLARVADQTQLERVGSGLYDAGMRTHVLEARDANVRQGYVEAANTVAMDEMIHIIETVRHFEASQRLMQGYDDMLDRAISLLGDV